MGKPLGNRHTPSYPRKSVTNWSGFNRIDCFPLPKTEQKSLNLSSAVHGGCLGSGVPKGPVEMPVGGTHEATSLASGWRGNGIRAPSCSTTAGQG